MHNKTKLRKMSNAQLVAMISFLLSYLKTYDSRAYAKAERIGGLRSQRGKGKVKKGGGGKHHKRLSQGVHKVRIKGKLRRVRVLPNGRWQFLKG